MRKAVVAVVVVTLPAAGWGCSNAVYNSEADFKYRVADLREVRFDQAPHDGGAAAPSQDGLSSLSVGPIVFEPGSGGRLALIDAAHGSLDVPRVRPGELVLLADGDQKIQIKVPPRTYSVGLSVYNRIGTKGDPPPAVIFMLENSPEERVAVPWTDPAKPAPAFVGLVSFKPITGVRWDAPPPVGQRQTGIAAVSYEQR